MSYIYDLTDTWNAGGTVFTALKMNVTNSASASGSKIISLQVNGTEQFSVDKDGKGYVAGNLGIGTSSPGAKLHVSGSEVRLQSTGGFYSFYDTAGTTRVGYIQNATGNIAIVNEQAGYVNFYTSNSERMRIDASGNVGVGTSSPLSVSGYKTLTLNDASGGAVAFNVNGTIAGSIASFSNDMYYDAVDATVFRNGAAFNGTPTERMRLDTSGNVGIGTSSPSVALQVQRSSANATIRIASSGGAGRDWDIKSQTDGYLTIGSDLLSNQLNLYAGNLGLGVTPSAWSATARAFEFGTYGALYQNASGYPELAFNTYVSTSNNYTYRNADVASRYLQYAGQHQWFNAPSGTAGNAISFTQAMTLDASGNLLVGTTSASGRKFWVSGDSAASFVTTIQNSSGTNPYGLQVYYSGVSGGGGQDFFVCGDNADRFKILGNGNAQNVNNSYGAISDLKLKENITDATPKLDDIGKVRVVNYNFIGDDTKQIGVIAQELEKIFPGMVEETVDTDALGNKIGTTTKSVKYSVFVPMLIKAIQELTARVAQLEGN